MLQKRNGAEEIMVRVRGEKARAVNYPPITGPTYPGDTVEVNTTAEDLGLGTGGYHFVYFNYSRRKASDNQPAGHIMKLRYTPQQLRVCSCEEGGNRRQKIEEGSDLKKATVLVGELHSMVAPLVLVMKRLRPRARLVFVMTDSASLPLSFSRNVDALCRRGLLAGTVTCGQAFGGNWEAVNVYTGLIAAFQLAEADAALLFPGPGVVGTGTRYGFSGMEVGENVNRILALGGTPVVVPRLSLADPRRRHRGISHHTLTSLTMLPVGSAYFPLPVLNGEEREIVEQQVKEYALAERHYLRKIEVRDTVEQPEAKSITLSFMGRSPWEDRIFYEGVAAAANLAADFMGSHPGVAGSAPALAGKKMTPSP